MFFGSQIPRADGYVPTRLMYRLISPCRRICSNDAIVPADFPCRRICSNKTNVPADLHELLSAAKNLPELSIRIFNPITSYFLIYRYVFRIADPYILCCRIFRCAQQHVHIRQNNSLVAYSPDGEHYPCGSQATICSNKTQ